MATKLWRGDAPAVAQVTRLTPGNVNVGDVFTVTCNGKTISVTAVTATAASVSALLVTAIAASTIPEFREFTASVDGSTVLLTANTAGQPFTVTSGATDASTLGVTIATTTAGAAGVSMVQSFAIPSVAAGTFTIVIGDQVTSAIAVGASAATVQTAIQALSTVGASNATVGLVVGTNDDVYTVTFAAALAATTVATMIVTLTSTKALIRTTQAGATTGTVQNEIQTVDVGDTPAAGTFTLTLSGQTTASLSTGSTAAQIETALEALSNVESVTVTKGGNVFTVEFVGIDGSANQAQMTASVYSGSLTSIHNLTTTIVTAAVNAVNEVQTVTLNGTPTGGTFTLTYSGQTTSSIAYNASAATVDAALEALSNIGAGDVVVTGDAGGPWTVTFATALAATDVAEMTATSSLTGTATETLVTSTVTANSGPNDWGTAANWLPSGVPITGDDVRFEIGSSECWWSLDQTGVTLASLHVAMSYTGKIGLPRRNAGGYVEYRTCELTCGITQLLIGIGSGSGPSKAAFNTLAVATAVEVRGSGGSSETGVSAVTWRGINVANTIEVSGGDFGTSPWDDQTCSFDTLIHKGGGQVALENATIATSILCVASSFFAYNCTLGGQAFEAR